MNIKLKIIVIALENKKNNSSNILLLEIPNYYQFRTYSSRVEFVGWEGSEMGWGGKEICNNYHFIIKLQMFLFCDHDQLLFFFLSTEQLH